MVNEINYCSSLYSTNTVQLGVRRELHRCVDRRPLEKNAKGVLTAFMQANDSFQMTVPADFATFHLLKQFAAFSERFGRLCVCVNSNAITGAVQAIYRERRVE